MAQDLFSRKTFIDKYLNKKDRYLSCFSFINIFLWKDFFTFKFELFDDNLCVFARNKTGCFLYLPPLGEKISMSAVKFSFDFMRQVNGGSGVTRIENITEHDFKDFSQNKYCFKKKSDEYFYNRQDIADLKGNIFKSKRNSYNKFIKNNSFEFKPYDPGMKEELLNLYDIWAGSRKKKYSDDIYSHMIDENRVVHNLAMRFYKELDLMGRVVYVGGKIKAYSFGYELNGQVFCILFEITDLDFDGISVFIFREFCDDPCLKKYKLINVMDDFGIENIKETKLSFNPDLIVPAFVCTN